MWKRISNPPLFYPSCLVLLWLIAVVLIHPFGEFPINDDWAYSKNVFNLVVHKQFILDPWPAMTLISQTLWGVLFTFLLGFSFTALKISTLVLAIIGSFGLYHLVLLLSKQRTHAFLITSIFCYNPLFLTLSFTYMTDVFFVVFLLLSFRSAFLYLSSGKKSDLGLFTLFCLIATLDRQYGILTPLVFLPVFLLMEKISTRSLIWAGFPLAVSLFGHYGYHLVLKLYHIPSNMSGMTKLSGYLDGFSIDQCLSKAVDILLLIGLICIPFAISAGLNLKTMRVKSLPALSCIALIVGVLIYFFGTHFPNGNVITLSGVGPKLIRNAEGREHLKFAMSNALLVLLKITGGISVTLLLFHLTRKEVSLKTLRTPVTLFYLGLRLFVLIYFLFSIANVNYFDRYILPILLVALLLTIPSWGPNELFQRLATGLYVFGFTLLTFFLVKDYYSWEQTRWTAIHDLEASGHNAHQIDGGFEYNGWYQPGPFGGNEKEPGKSWWWVDKDVFIIAAAPVKSYLLRKTFVYQHCIPFERDTVFVLEKDTLTNLSR